jgi:hypothetical protein
MGTPINERELLLKKFGEEFDRFQKQYRRQLTTPDGTANGGAEFSEQSERLHEAGLKLKRIIHQLDRLGNVDHLSDGLT